MAPQPSDLTNPIPGQQAMTMDQIFAPQKQSGLTMGQMFGVSRSPAAAQPTPIPNQATTAPTPSDADLLGQLGPEPTKAGPTDEELLNALGPNPDDIAIPAGEDKEAIRARTGFDGPRDYFNNIKDRALAGLGTNLVQSKEILEKKYGKGNVKMMGDKLAVKGPNGKFVSLESDQLGFFADLLGDIADVSGALVEGATAVPFEAAGAIAGALSPVPGGAALGLVAGAGIGGVEGNRVRHGLISAAGGVTGNEPSFQSDLVSGATNVAALGAGAAAKGILQGSINVARRFIDNAPMKRLEALANVRNAFNDIVERYSPIRIRGKEIVTGVPSTASETQTAVTSAADSMRQQIGTEVGLMDSKILSASGDAKHPVSNFLSELRDVLKKNDVTFDSDGTAKLSGEVGGFELDIPASREVPSVIVDSSGKPMTKTEKFTQTLKFPGEEVKAPIAPMGVSEGQGWIKKLVDDYNLMLSEQKNGGLKASELFRMVRQYQDIAGWEKEFGTRTTKTIKGIGSGIEKDRNEMALRVLGNTKEGAQFRQAYDNFAAKTEDLRDFEKLIIRKENAPIVSDAIIQPQKPNDIQKFKRLFGEDSQAWQTVKSYFIDNLFKEQIDPMTGILNPRGLINTIEKKYGEEVMGEVFTKQELREIKKIALKANKIQVDDLMSPESYQNYAMGLISAPFVAGMSGYSKARLIWNMVKGAPQAAEYLLEKGFLDKARTLPPTERNALVEVFANYKSFYNNAKLVNGKNGKQSFVDLPWKSAAAVSLARNEVAATGREAARMNPQNQPSPQPTPEMEQVVRDALLEQK